MPTIPTMNVATYPKVDLHRHLEGSLRLDTLIDLAREQGRWLPSSTPTGLARHAQVLEPFNDLQAVLEAFALFQESFQTTDAVERIAYEAVEDAARDCVKLLELRFSPDFMARPAKLDWDRLMEALMRGVTRASEDYDIRVGLIAIVSRRYGPDSAMETVAFALNWRDSLVGFDLADSEDGFAPEQFARPLAPLAKAGLPLTVHSGENTSSAFIAKAIDVLGAQRIGHGISLIDDPELAERCARDGIGIEMCPTSNVRTRAVASYGSHPARPLLSLGVPVTLNSDDPGLFNITLSGELAIARRELGFDDASLEAITQNALNVSFVSSEEKKALLETTPEWRFD